MRYNILIPRTFLPLESVQLGRFVLNVDEPQQDYLDPVCNLRAEVVIKTQLSYEEVQQSSTDKTFAAILTRLASASRTKRNKIFTQVTTDRVATYQLGNSGPWFKDAVKTETTRKWIIQAVDQGDDVYVIVGYHTMLDAQIVEGAAAAKESFARLEMPVTASLAAAGVVIPISDIADPGAAGHDRNSQRVRRRFVANGEQICAVQYRKVRFRWFSSRDLDSAALEKENRWKVYWNIRGMEIGSNDVLEADLQDELELEGDREEHTSETEGVFLV